MTSHGFAQLLATLGVSRSFSRPRVSDDNAFSEACFKTLKYQSDYPGRFENLEHARAWLADFFDWYGREHHHHGLALFTPEDVFLGRVNEIAVVRQAALDDAFEAHPERFPNGRPTVRLPNAVVAINPVPPLHDDGKDVVLETLASQTSSEAAAASPSTERQLAPPSKAKPKITRSAFVAALAT